MIICVVLLFALPVCCLLLCVYLWLVVCFDWLFIELIVVVCCRCLTLLVSCFEYCLFLNTLLWGDLGSTFLCLVALLVCWLLLVCVLLCDFTLVNCVNLVCFSVCLRDLCLLVSFEFVA